MENYFGALIALAPMTTVTLVSLIVVLVDAASKKGERASYWITVIGLAIAILFGILSFSKHGLVFNRMVVVGGVGNYFSILFAIIALMTAVLSRPYLEKQNIHHGEYYALILFSSIGMMLMASAADLVVLFLGLELMSICLYALAGFMKTQMQSNEAAIKYFLLGAFSTGFLLYGIALIYGASATTNIIDLSEQFPILIGSPIFWIGAGLLLIGLSFKVAAVPFHMWVPDVYQGAPTTVAAYMSTASKAAAFAAILAVFGKETFHSLQLENALAFLAAASMIVGNIVALSQKNLKRMLAYSSIAHAGYMLSGLAAQNSLGSEGVVFYATIYSFMNIGAFGFLSLIEAPGDQNLTYEEYGGLGVKKPLLAALMAIFMFSLAGIPPFAGFFAKYYVFAAAVDAKLTWLAVVGVLTSLISVYYYLRLVVFMYFKDDSPTSFDATSSSALAIVFLAAVVIVAAGVYPSAILSITHHLF